MRRILIDGIIFFEFSILFAYSKTKNVYEYKINYVFITRV